MSTNIFDHVLKFDSEEDAITALAPLGFHFTSDDGDYWDGSRCIPGVSIVLADAVWDNSDPENPTLVSPPITLTGWWIAIGLPAVSDALRDLPDNACRLIADRDAANAEQPFLTYVAPDIDLEALASARVDPTFAGASYPFGET